MRKEAFGLEPETMYALVKERADKGLTLKKVPVPEAGPGDVKIKIHYTSICGTDLHIYNWDKWSQETIRPGTVIGHEFVGRSCGAGQRCLRLFGGRHRLRRGAYRVRPLPQLQGRQTPSVQTDKGRGRQPRRRVRGISRHPPDQRHSVRAGHSGGAVLLIRSAGKRRAHSAHVRPCWRGRAHHRGRAHRHHGRGHLPSCGRKACRYYGT